MCLFKRKAGNDFHIVFGGGSRISPRWRRQPSWGGGGGAPTYDFAKFSQKLHEIERIWTNLPLVFNIRSSELKLFLGIKFEIKRVDLEIVRSCTKDLHKLTNCTLNDSDNPVQSFGCPPKCANHIY